MCHAVCIASGGLGRLKSLVSSQRFQNSEMVSGGPRVRNVSSSLKSVRAARFQNYLKGSIISPWTSKRAWRYEQTQMVPGGLGSPRGPGAATQASRVSRCCQRLESVASFNRSEWLQSFSGLGSFKRMRHLGSLKCIKSCDSPEVPEVPKVSEASDASIISEVSESINFFKWRRSPEALKIENVIVAEKVSNVSDGSPERLQRPKSLKRPGSLEDHKCLKLSKLLERLRRPRAISQGFRDCWDFSEVWKACEGGEVGMRSSEALRGLRNLRCLERLRCLRSWKF